jgi:hypothetical protein
MTEGHIAGLQDIPRARKSSWGKQRRGEILLSSVDIELRARSPLALNNGPTHLLDIHMAAAGVVFKTGLNLA